MTHSIFKSAVLSAFGLMSAGSLVMTAADPQQAVAGPDHLAHEMQVQTADGKWVVLRRDKHGAFRAFRRGRDHHTLTEILDERITINSHGSQLILPLRRNGIHCMPKGTGWVESGCPQ